MSEVQGYDYSDPSGPVVIAASVSRRGTGGTVVHARPLDKRKNVYNIHPGRTLPVEDGPRETEIKAPLVNRDVPETRA